MLNCSLGSPGSGDYGMEMDDMDGMHGQMEDMEGMDYEDDSQAMVRYISFAAANRLNRKYSLRRKVTKTRSISTRTPPSPTCPRSTR